MFFICEQGLDATPEGILQTLMVFLISCAFKPPATVEKMCEQMKKDRLHAATGSLCLFVVFVASVLGSCFFSSRYVGGLCLGKPPSEGKLEMLGSAVTTDARLGSGTTRPAVLIVFDASTLPASLAFTTSGSTQSIKLRVELSLRLDEGTTVVAHGLVSGVGVLGEDGECRSDNDGDEENQREDSVEDEEEDTHDTIDQARKLKKQMAMLKALVFLSILDDEEGDGLECATTLTEGDKHALEKEVSQDWDDEVVGSGLELDVEEAPLVKRDGIRIEDVGRVLVHRDGTTGKTDDLGRSPGEYANHSEDSEDGKNDFGSRVTLGELPETENDHLRETDENQTEKNTFENGGP
ncbi:TRP-domain-containing protein, partial [Aureobasidium melanogenum]